MRWPPALRVFAATLVALAVLGFGSLAPGGRIARNLAGADRVRERPREGQPRRDLLARARRRAARHLAHPGAEHGLAVAPVAIRSRSGATGAATTRCTSPAPTGPRLRLVRGLGDSAAPSRFAPGWCADLLGRRLVARRGALQGSHQRRLRDRRATGDRRAIRRCGGVLQPSPDGKLLACSVHGSTSVLDIAGHLRFTLPYSGVIWSSRGWLTASAGDSPASPPGSSMRRAAPWRA